MTELITRTDLETLVAIGDVVLIDALPASYYDQLHLPAALNLEECDVDTEAHRLLPDKNATIVTYCSNAACGNSQAVANRLERLGYTSVRKYREGIQDWVSVGNPTESTPPLRLPSLSHHVRSTTMSDTTTSEPSPIRTIDGHVLPAPGAWEIDSGHTDVAFIGRHFMLTKVRGRFTDVTGTVVIAPHLNDSTIEVTINMASVESGNRERDTHIKSAELFDVEQFPTAIFRSSAVDWRGTSGVIRGDLTIHGVTLNASLAVTFEGHVHDPWGGDRAIFSAMTKVNREDFGVTWNMPLEAGGLLVSKEIQIEIDLETVLNRE